MKANSPAQVISIGGILTALAVLFQSSPALLPGIGLILSPFSTLPIALAALVSVYSGILALYASALILIVISPQEAVIFLLTTGPLGLVLGASYTKGTVPSIAIAGATLFIGMNILTHIVGVAIFGSMTPNSSPIITASIFMLFSVFYTGIWVLILKYFINIFKRTSHFSIFNPYKRK